MHKVLFNVMVILLLAAPCMLVFSDSVFLMFMGMVYTATFIKNIVMPIYRKVVIK